MPIVSSLRVTLRGILRPEPGGDTIRGGLPPGVVGVLDAVATSLLQDDPGEALDLDRYRAVWEWRATSCPGYLAAYLRSIDALDRASLRQHGARFVELDAMTRRRTLAPIQQLALEEGWQLRRRRLVTARRWWVVHEYVVTDLLVLYSRTDAWLAAGYGSAPGQPRPWAAGSGPAQVSR